LDFRRSLRARVSLFPTVFAASSRQPHTAAHGLLAFGKKLWRDAMDPSNQMVETEPESQRESWLLFRGLVIVGVVAVATFVLVVAYRPDWLLTSFTH
jgi:hypothetical protein